MIISVGELWEYPAELRVVTTNGMTSNGRAIMGKGSAREARDLYRGIDRTLGELIDLYGNHVYLIRRTELRNDWIASFPTKHDWRHDADPELIERSAHELKALVDEHQIASVVMPRPGCGYGHLDWETCIKPRIAPILDNRFTVITRPRRQS